jgi:flagellar motor protein MotB
MRRRSRHIREPENHDRWLVSYSDFITVLFAFFVVLFACSYRDNQQIKKLSQAIHVGFQQLGAFSGGQTSYGVAYPDQTLKGSDGPASPQAQTPPADLTTGKMPADSRSEATGVDIGDGILRDQRRNVVQDANAHCDGSSYRIPPAPNPFC